MNHRHLITLLQENYTTVSVVFTGAETDSEDLKRYTYKLPLGDYYEPGDFAVVMTPSGLKLVQIVEIHVKPRIDLQAEYTYKWIVQKVDMSEYNARVEKEEAFLDILTDIERTHQRNILLEKFQEYLDPESKELFENARARLLGNDEEPRD